MSFTTVGSISSVPAIDNTVYILYWGSIYEESCLWDINSCELTLSSEAKKWFERFTKIPEIIVIRDSCLTSHFEKFVIENPVGFDNIQHLELNDSVVESIIGKPQPLIIVSPEISEDSEPGTETEPDPFVIIRNCRGTSSLYEINPEKYQIELDEKARQERYTRWRTLGRKTDDIVKTW